MYGKTKIARAKQLKLTCGKMGKPFMVAMKGYEMLPIKLSKDVSEREEGLKKREKTVSLFTGDGCIRDKGGSRRIKIREVREQGAGSGRF